MRKLITALLILAFVLPVPRHVRADDMPPALDLRYTGPYKDIAFSSEAVKLAALDSSDFVPVEKKLISEQKAAGEKKSNWWKWTLGALLVIGVAAAAGGGGGGGGGSTGTSTGSVAVGW